jgi:murein DD-endopeptidase MepM/ murein hydrolase activator NlpD
VPLALPQPVRWPSPRVLPVRPSSSGRLFNSPSYCWRPSDPPGRSLSRAVASAPRREADRLSRRRRQVRYRALAVLAVLTIVLTGVGRNLLGQLTDRTADLFMERNRNLTLADSIVQFQVALEARVKRSVVLQRSVKGRPEMPIAGRVSSRFTSRRLHPLLMTWRPHRGVDIDAPSGTLLHPVVPGRVVKVARNFGYGLFVEVDHGGGVSTRYAHLREAHVRAGQLVRPNMTLGKSGSSGFASGPHLHYEVMKHGRQVDPLTFQLVVLERVPASIERVAAKPDSGQLRAVALPGDPQGSKSRRGLGKGADNGPAAPKPNGAGVSAPRTGVSSSFLPFDGGRFK